MVELDGCYRSSNYTDCVSVSNGLFTNGLHPALTSFARTAQDVEAGILRGLWANATLQVRVPVSVSCLSCGTPPQVCNCGLPVRVFSDNPVQERLNGSSWKEMEHVGFYLGQGLDTADLLRLQIALDTGASYAWLMNALQVCHGSSQ